MDKDMNVELGEQFEREVDTITEVVQEVLTIFKERNFNTAMAVTIASSLFLHVVDSVGDDMMESVDRLREHAQLWKVLAAAAARKKYEQA